TATPPAEPPPHVQTLRRGAAPALGVAWRYATLAATRITAGNDFAADALGVFRQTVDGFLGRMVMLTQPAVLRCGPGPGFEAVQALDGGVAVLLEPDPSPADSSLAWRRVRLPSTTTVGWLEAGVLRSLAHAR
ncbi:MAG: hypothetical protein AB1505_33065, partial [Candidatus Latescibacterota bacterium]